VTSRTVAIYPYPLVKPLAPARNIPESFAHALVSSK
jgi:hypothetical protein